MKLQIEKPHFQHFFQNVMKTDPSRAEKNLEKYQIIWIKTWPPCLLWRKFNRLLGFGFAELQSQINFRRGPTKCFGVTPNEQAYLPTKYSSSRKDPRFPSTYEDPCWSRHPCSSSPQGSHRTVCVVTFAGSREPAQISRRFSVHHANRTQSCRNQHGSLSQTKWWWFRPTLWIRSLKVSRLSRSKKPGQTQIEICNQGKTSKIRERARRGYSCTACR